MIENPTPEQIERLTKERALFLRLLELGSQDDLQLLLKDALQLIVELAGAAKGYLELVDKQQEGGEPRWWFATGCADGEIDGIRDSISRGIIGEAIAAGRTVATASAVTDPQFQGYESVQLNRIEAVLCCPIGAAHPTGVLYLQSRDQPGPFTVDDRHHAELFACHLAPLVDRVRHRTNQLDRDDPTRPWRESLDVDGIVGRSQALADVLRVVSLVSPMDIDVLISGPTGTGKTAIARAIHHSSARAAGPLVELNCAAIPENLLESELFGHAKGAFTGATADRAGRFEAADGGTLFLDEIGDMSVALQVKLLRVVQERILERVGETRSRSVNIRIIAATNQDLDAAVAEGRFRQDLYYRLNVVPLTMPSLADRSEDIPLLAEHLLDLFVRKHRLPRLILDSSAATTLQTSRWPGNVRQLSNIIERAAAFAAGEGVPAIESRHLEGAPAPADGEGGGGDDGTYQESTRRFQKQLLARALKGHDWNVAATARSLQLSRSNLYELIKTHGLERS